MLIQNTSNLNLDDGLPSSFAFSSAQIQGMWPNLPQNGIAIILYPSKQGSSSETPPTTIINFSQEEKKKDDIFQIAVVICRVVFFLCL